MRWGSQWDTHEGPYCHSTRSEVFLQVTGNRGMMWLLYGDFSAFIKDIVHKRGELGLKIFRNSFIEAWEGPELVQLE